MRRRGDSARRRGRSTTRVRWPGVSRSVAVGDNDLVLAGQFGDRRHGGGDVRALRDNVRGLTAAQEGVAAEGDDHAHDLAFTGAAHGAEVLSSAAAPAAGRLATSWPTIGWRR